MATLSGTPDSADVGDHLVVLRVADQVGASAEQFFTVTVGEALTRTGSVQGSVVDAEGNSVPGVTVTLSNGSSANQSVPAALLLVRTTDAKGGYRFDGVSPGAYTLMFAKEGYIGAGPVPVTVREGETETVAVVVLTVVPDSGDGFVYLPIKEGGSAAAAARTKGEDAVEPGLYLPNFAR